MNRSPFDRAVALAGMLCCGVAVGCTGEAGEASDASDAPARGAPGFVTDKAAIGTPASTSNQTSPPAVTAPVTAPTPTSQNTAPVVAPGAPAVTYHRDVRPILERSCVECHGGKPEDRIAPFSLDSWQSVSDAVASWDVIGAVDTGRMPPWMPADGCRDLHDKRSLPAETRALFLAWRSAGYPEGDAAQYVAPEPRRGALLGEPTLVLAVPAPYMPRVNDEYTCFGLADPSGDLYTSPDERYLVAIQVLPGEPSEVHHVQVHRTNGAPAAGPTDCSGFVAGSAENVFSWRPGSTPLLYPEGSASRIPRGNGFTVQIHYNATFAMNGAQPDRTRVAFWFMSEGTPKALVTRRQVLGPVNIPAGAPEVISNRSETVDGSNEIVGITPHAHMLATKMSATATIGGTEHCLIDIPKWDFHWQGDYLFEQPLAATGGARIDITCVWDNSAQNQPIVNMQQLQPRNVTFGEGTFAEMCLHYIWLRSPFPSDAAQPAAR